MADQDTPAPQPEQVLKHPANQELFTFLGNLVIEARQQVISLQALYRMIRDWETPAPAMWAHKLVEEQENHVTRVTEHITGMKAALG